MKLISSLLGLLLIFSCTKSRAVYEEDNFVPIHQTVTVTNTIFSSLNISEYIASSATTTGTVYSLATYSVTNSGAQSTLTINYGNSSKTYPDRRNRKGNIVFYYSTPFLPSTQTCTLQLLNFVVNAYTFNGNIIVNTSPSTSYSNTNNYNINSTDLKISGEGYTNVSLNMSFSIAKRLLAYYLKGSVSSNNFNSSINDSLMWGSNFFTKGFMKVNAKQLFNLNYGNGAGDSIAVVTGNDTRRYYLNLNNY
ncbi:MAG: hypothetical protein JSU07_14230 [Bacteroidetes bacterium]|nr:hypothetical protein [Bacteroidota bacterium]